MQEASARPGSQQGLKVLGTPLGTDEFVAAHLHTLSVQHRPFLELVPTLPDLQVAWLLLLYCASPRAQYILRAVPLTLTAVFAAEHDRSMLAGLGLRSAAAHAPAAYFASWADSLRAIRTRESVFCEDLLQQLAGPACNRRCLAWLQGATVVLTNHGLSVPVWGELVTEPPAEAEADPALHEPADLARGWQRSAAAHAPAAYFASWADSLRAIRTRESIFCEDILQQLAGPACNRRCLASLQGAAVVLTNHGLSVPVWGELVTEPPAEAEAEAEADPALHEPADLARGWQRAASKVVDDALLADLTSALDEAPTALLHSQAGPFAGRVYTALPTCPELRLDSAAFRVLLLRRLRLPLPLAVRLDATCRCGTHLDPFGDHRAACPRAGLLRGRGIPLERAAARVCREAGATVAANVLLRDLNIITRGVTSRHHQFFVPLPLVICTIELDEGRMRCCRRWRQRNSSVAVVESAIDAIVGEQLDSAALHATMVEVLASLDAIQRELENPVYRSSGSKQVVGKVSPQALRVLSACGIRQEKKGFSVRAQSSLEVLQAAIGIIRQLLLSLEEDSSAKPEAPRRQPAPSAGSGGRSHGFYRHDDSEKAHDVSPEAETTDAEVSRLAAGSPRSPEDPGPEVPAEQRSTTAFAEPKVVSFERFDASKFRVTPADVVGIERACAQRGETYVDPQFAPTAASLYLAAAEEHTWQCLICNAHSRLPPVPPLANSREEAAQQEQDFKSEVRCQGCGQPAHYVVQVRYFTRPTQWLRPGHACEGCQLIWSQLHNGNTLAATMCTHYLRDSAIYRPLVKKDWTLAIYFHVLILLVFVVLMNLVTAVIVNSAFEQARVILMLVLVLDFVLNGFLVTSSYVAAESVAQDREAQQVYEQRRKEKLVGDLVRTFQKLDLNGDGKICQDELMGASGPWGADSEGLESKALRLRLYSNLKLDNPEEIFMTLDVDGTGEIDITEFCEGVLQAVTSEGSIELKRMDKQIKSMKKQLSEMERNQAGFGDLLTQALQETRFLVQSAYVNDALPREVSVSNVNNVEEGPPAWAKAMMLD
eukprot:s3110_g3.t1